MLSRTKTKKSSFKKCSTQTGGGAASNEVFTPLEKEILEMLGETAISGITDVVESNVRFIDTALHTEETYSEAESENPIDPLGNVNPKEETLIEQQSQPSTSRTPVPDKKKIITKTSHRLEKSLEESNKMYLLMKEKLEIKREYYKKKN